MLKSKLDRYIADTIPLYTAYYTKNTGMSYYDNIDYCINEGIFLSGFYTWGLNKYYINFHHYLPSRWIDFDGNYHSSTKLKTYFKNNCFEWTKSDLSKFIMLTGK